MSDPSRIDSMQPLHTNRLRLRSWEPEDADFVYDMYSRWDVMRFIGQEPQVMTDRSHADKLIERCRSLDHPIHGFWAVERIQDFQLVGTILLKSIPSSGEPPLQPSGDTEIGWHFHPDYWGNGYASEAAHAVLQYGFDKGLERIVAVTAPENVASQGVCRRLGMTHIGITDRYYNSQCELFEVSRTGL